MEHKKEVYYFMWCPSCRHFEVTEDESPCDECLSISAREDSHKPYYYEPADE